MPEDNSTPANSGMGQKAPGAQPTQIGARVQSFEHTFNANTGKSTVRQVFIPGTDSPSAEQAFRLQKAREQASRSATPASYKRGGPVRKTGTALVHEGERVLTKRQAKRYRGRSAGR